MSDRAIVQVTEYRRRRYRIVDRVTLVPLGQDARLACRRLSRMIDRPRPPRVADVREALVTLTLLMLRRVVPRQGGRQSLIEQAQEYIRTHPDPSLADVARAVLLSPNYLTSLFRAETGLSLGSTIQRERMVRAKELLADSRRTVKDVAYEIGFDDPSSFSRAFKRVEGISPLHFRRGQC